MHYRNRYYYDKRGHVHTRRSYSHSSSPDHKPKNQDSDKKGQVQDSSKVNSAPKSNKQESVKDPEEKNLESSKPIEENKTCNDNA